ncbi:MAG: GTP-binding protein [Nanoarchaeota archaeon]|nr:GTP-binding protein [Nanoarchaeota archaeon]
MCEEDEEYKKKVTLIGLNAVGKTSLINQFVNKSFSTSYKSTLKTDIYTKYVETTVKDETYKVKLIILDTAGTIKDSLLKKYSKGSDGVMLVFDLTRGYTLNILRDRIVESNLSDVPTIVIGNKTDLIDAFVEEYKIEDISEAHINPHLKMEFNLWMHKRHKEVIEFYERKDGIIPQFDPFLVKKVDEKYVGPLDEMVNTIYTSAKEDQNVDLAFSTIARKIIRRDMKYNALEEKLAEMLE